MQPVNIADIEADRNTDEKCRIIHIYAEGKFCRAYEWSAWLLSTGGPGMKTSLQSKKGSGKLIAVGFPINSEASWKKYMPAGAMRAKSADGSHDVLVLPKGAFGSATPQSLAANFAQWRAEREAEIQAVSDKEAAEKNMARQKVADSAPQQPAVSAAARPAKSEPATMAGLLRELNDLDVDSLSPRQCQAFLWSIKSKLNVLIGF